MSDSPPRFIPPQPNAPWWRGRARAMRRAVLRWRMDHAPAARKKEWNGRLNWREFWHGQVCLESFPRLVQVGTNWTCNLRCSFCRLSMDWMRDHLRQKARADLQLSPKVFEAVKNLLPYAEMMTLTPLGEPLLWSGLDEMLQLHARLGSHNLALTSNGMLLDDAMAERLVRGQLNALYLSIDSNDPEVYASMRVGGDLRRVEEGIRRINAWKVRLAVPWPALTINATFMARNLDQLASMVDWARALGCGTLSVQLMETENPEHEPEFLGHHVERARAAVATAVTRGRQIGLAVRPHEALTGLLQAAAAGRDVTGHPLPPGAQAGGPGSPSAAKKPPEETPRGTAGWLIERCSLPWHNVMIDTDGAVRPCCWAEACWGNLNSTDFAEIWNGAPAIGMRRAFLRDIVPPSCRQRHCRVDL